MTTAVAQDRLAALEAAYETQRREGRLPATYEVVYGHAWAPALAARGRHTDAGFAIPVGAIGRQRPPGGGGL